MQLLTFQLFVIHVGPQFMTSNVHQLLHLRDSVEDLGPLWCHSCFFFKTSMEISEIYFMAPKILMDRLVLLCVKVFGAICSSSCLNKTCSKVK